MDGRRVCAFTGHRDFDFFCLGDRTIKDNLMYELEHLLDSGVDKFYCGMAEGFDLAAAEGLLHFAGKYRFSLVAAIPFPRQSASYFDDQKERYNEILKSCTEKVVLYDNYVNGCLLARDRYMVDRSDVVLCFLRRDSGGTFYTVSYAKRLQKEVLYV